MNRTTIQNEPKILEKIEELFESMISEWHLKDTMDFDCSKEWYIDYLKELNAFSFKAGFDAGALLRKNTDTLYEYQTIKTKPTEES